jgi:hypothetical protein
VPSIRVTRLPAGARWEPQPRPQLPDGNYDVPAGAVRAALRRLSPRKSWPEVTALDQKVHELEGRQVEIAAEASRLREELPLIQVRDQEALDAWHASGSKGNRPAAKLPEIETRIAECEADVESVNRAIDGILAEKVALVERSRSRLVRDARRDAKAAAKTARVAIAELAQARERLLVAVEAQLWAGNYPKEAPVVELQRAFAGRRSRSIPALTTTLSAEELISALVEDLDVVGAPRIVPARMRNLTCVAKRSGSTVRMVALRLIARSSVRSRRNVGNGACSPRRISRTAPAGKPRSQAGTPRPDGTERR